MPIYEYQCTQCGKTFEHLTRTASEPAPQCPKCGAKRPRKLVSAFNANAAGASTGSSCPTGSCCTTGTCGLP
ncbi:MAG: zinc ribbon domain-containing protein [Verrucomicrobia bacterium]|nr:zinc ribbon domain-containing protein [Verrucomicrobiota bacterium]